MLRSDCERCLPRLYEYEKYDIMQCPECGAYHIKIDGYGWRWRPKWWLRIFHPVRLNHWEKLKGKENE